MAEQKTFPWGTVILAVFLVIAVFAAIWLYLRPTVKTVTTTVAGPPQYVNVPVETTVEKIVKVPVYITKIITYDKQAIVKALDLPFKAVSSNSTQVIADAQIPTTRSDGENVGGGSAVALLDTSTGNSEIIFKPDEPPWWTFKNNINLGLYYGLSSREGQSGQIDGRWTFLRTGRLEWDLKGMITTRTEAVILGGVHMEFNP
jgi:hypothetical protein